MDGGEREIHMLSTPSLTQRQIRRMQALPQGHVVLSTRKGVAVVRRPDGRLLRIQPDGRLAGMIRVERVQSYLHVNG
jgi:hypothetical protein